MTAPRHGMFSEEGNQQIADLIEFHRNNKSTWPTVLENLRDIAESDYDLFGEAMDTDVREGVYHALGFKTEFYI